MKKLDFINHFSALVALSLLGLGLVQAQNSDKGVPDRDLLNKVSGTPLWQNLDINNINSWQRSDGRCFTSPNGDPNSLYPKGTVSAISGGGYLWAGKVYLDAAHTIPPSGQVIRMGGHFRGSAARAGRVIGSGASATGTDPALDEVRIYKIRRDYKQIPSDELRTSVSGFLQVMPSSITQTQIDAYLAQYDKDWKEWPVQYGAPYIDRNRNGRYDKPPAFSETFTVDSLIAGNYDEPGVAGADPNSPADQVMWTVYNDLDPAPTLCASEKLGTEAQATTWGYKSTGPLGQVFFRRVKIINKGGVSLGGGQKGALYIDSMYIAHELDPDLGDFTEDVIGCDTLLSLGFIYNGIAVDRQYKTFGLPPPSIGFDFLQGPRARSSGDSAVFDLKRIYGWKNLPMTSFSYYSSGGAVSDPPATTYEGCLRWYKLVRGFIPDPSTAVDRLYAHPPGVTPTKYPLSGDPVAKTGFLDGLATLYSMAPGDRREVLSSGPFALAPGDTQELVVGTVGGLGADRISSVAVMKFNDRFVQNTYDALFSVPRPPTAPKVNVTELDGKVILEWGSDAARCTDTEMKVVQPGGYTFEGYNVYQFPRRTSPFADAKLIAAFDLPTDPSVVLDERFDTKSGQILKVPVHFGTNSGIRRFFEFKRDYVLDVEQVYNGQEYILGVTAYSVATVPGYLPATLESNPTVVIATPKVPFGKIYSSVYGDTLKSSHSGPSEGLIRPVVVDPSAVTGDTYEVSFDRQSVTNFEWKVTNKTKNRVAVSGQTNQSGDDRYIIVDGVMTKVVGPALAGKEYTATPSANRWFIQGIGAAGELLGGGAYLGANFKNGSTVEALDYKIVEVRFVARTGYTDLNGNGSYDIGEPYTLPAAGTQKAFFYRGLTDNSFEGFFDVPFTVWDVQNPASPRQLNVIVHDPDQNKQWDVHYQLYDPKLPNNGDQGYNYVWVTASTYDATGVKYDPTKAGGKGWMGTNEGANEAYWVLWLSLRSGRAPYTPSVTLKLVPYVINTNQDTFTYSTVGPTIGKDQETSSSEKVGVFPNPYYAYNPAEIYRFGRFVTFTNLTPKATIRIFNIGGEIVRILNKNEPSQFFRWDLANQGNIPVASGMYIVHIEMELPADGSKVTRILKVAIIQEQEVLEVY